jgi:hypothetical protein
MSDLFGGKYNFNLGDKYGFNTSTLVDNFQKQKEDESSSKEKKRVGPFDFLKNQITKMQEGDDEKMADYLKGQSYMPEKKSSRDQLADFVLSRFGGGSGFGGAQDVAQGLTLSGQGGGLNQPVVIAGKEGSGGIRGGISGAAQGYLASGLNPLGAAAGFLGGLFS